MGSIGGNTSTSPWYKLPADKRPEAGLLKLRKSLNLTQSTFAAVMGVSNKTVEAWEKGTNTPAGTARRMMGLLITDNSILEKIMA